MSVPRMIGGVPIGICGVPAQTIPAIPGQGTHAKAPSESCSGQGPFACEG